MPKYIDINSPNEFVAHCRGTYLRIKCHLGMISAYGVPLNKLNLDKWDISQCTDTSNMFKGCNLSGIDISGWDTGNVQNMNNMFEYAINVGDISTWNTSNCRQMRGTFKNYDGDIPDISSWDTSSLTTGKGIFAFCYSGTPDISAWNLDNCTDKELMYGAPEVYSFDGGFDIGFGLF